MTNNAPTIWSKIQIPAAIALVLLAIFAVSRTLSGCSDEAARATGNTKEQVAADHAAALKRIDNMNISAADKQMIKEHIGLAPGGGRPTGPPAGVH